MSKLPLEGVRIADLTWVIAGPYGTYLLARMGADVIKIEGLTPIDHIRDNPPFADNRPGVNRSGFFNMLNAGKKSVTLRLDEVEHLAIAKEIIAQCDVVVESFSYGTMERLGLSYETLRKFNPDLIMVSCSGFGQTGRDRSLRAFMGTVHAYSGLNSINGYAGGPPKPAGGTLADYATGTMLVFAAVAALRNRARTGEGQHIDLSMADVVLSTMGESYVDYFMNGRVASPRGNGSEYACPNDVYRCTGDDAWVAISVENDDQWKALCDVVSANDLSPYVTLEARRQHIGEIDARIADWTRSRTPLEATEVLQGAGVPVGPSSSAGALLGQPQLRDRGFFVAPEHSEVGERDIPGMPWRISTHSKPPCAPAPLLGQHNDSVLRDLLGREQIDIDRLNAERDAALRSNQGE